MTPKSDERLSAEQIVQWFTGRLLEDHRYLYMQELAGLENRIRSLSALQETAAQDYGHPGVIEICEMQNKLRGVAAPSAGEPEDGWAEGPDGDKDVMAYINKTPMLLSLLYDLNLLPEQHMDKERDGEEWDKIFAITNHFREAELALTTDLARVRDRIKYHESERDNLILAAENNLDRALAAEKNVVEYMIAQLDTEKLLRESEQAREAAERELRQLRHWLDNNTTFYDVGVGDDVPVPASVSKRIWYHATDNMTGYPFSAVIDAAGSQGK